NNYLSVNINPQHVVTITYPSWFRGSETIRFTATDPHGATDYDDVTFTITECQVPNTPPVIEGLPDLNVNEDTGYWEALIDLWAYAYDNETPDSGLTFSITSQTNNAIVDCIVDHNQHIDCATLPNMNGCSNVTVRVTDPQTLYDEDTFRICVQPINDAPQVGEIPNQTIDSCHQFTQFDLDDYVNDVDNSDNQITWTYSGNNYLSVNINPQHVVTITYPSWFRGSETIRFTATDPHGASDYDDVTFTVTECQGENTPPTLNIPDQTYEESSGMHTIDLWQYAQDNETPDDQLTFIIVNQTHPEIVNCAIRDNRFLDCTVQPNMVGYSDITVRVTDLGGLYDEDTFRITVTEEEIEEDHEVAPSIQITRVIYDDNVMQGGYMHVNIYVQGNKIKNTEARIIIPDLNIDEEFNRFKQIEIKIPEDAETGYHTMEVWVKSNHNEQDRVYEQFFVQPKETKQKTTYEAEGSKTTGSVTASKYNISQETILTLIAISLTIILIIILIMIIATLTTKK
ncbi:MAG: Ig-like domain-containing protein, partial [Candidatus Nanoarchaeia archaeon]